MTKLLKWYVQETGELVGEFPDDTPWDGDPLCPKCGKPTHYWCGQVDQDFMGNDIEGEHHVCYECWIGTEITIVD